MGNIVEHATGIPLHLGPAIYRPSTVCREVCVRVADDLRKLVFFLGFPDGTKDGPGIKCIGTGFFIGYKKVQYFVTVKHVALALGDTPFLIRLNKTNGESKNIDIDVGDVRWFTHSDRDVDLAVVPFHYDLKKEGYDVRFGGGLEDITVPSGFDCGDFCYTIGLFQLLAGAKRNLPVVHSGNIALLPSDEKIPVRDWEKEGSTRYVEGYLVQSESIQGLSGAPVFARSHVELSDFPLADGKTLPVIVPQKTVSLLGVWQGAWDARSDAVRSASLGHELRVPVGMGIVIPAHKIVEILEMPDPKKHREDLLKKLKDNSSAALDSVPVPTLKSRDQNPNHKADFDNLLNKAAKVAKDQ